MESIDEGSDDAAPEADLDSRPEELWRSLVSDEEYPRYRSESVWNLDAEDRLAPGPLLFADLADEGDLGNELRLSELWGHCESRCLSTEEFIELSALLMEVRGIPGSLCVDCDMLGRTSVAANWALAATHLCGAHLRFRLGHARIDRGTGHSEANRPD
jgi:hypothetical protein